ncbi:outer membrane beta-barrel protein [Cytophagaceae bacterium DM2B3-1]|uniref:Outer membrane beta-barrel protein n=1 Tax=Xanthocytophaga flava TaxID=3048013 RepID=A0ABT7CM32_9BACT|nr:outer membrane beta-barrel protein [Xanthocytophaga flavus]MDJ1467255.1 outer membrane beta-barrel protein [Xanthocytophaga flavus]MDJ1494758.1 outer membrane beta-barrel protein [Xanthocytophaga flavus]
MKKIFIAAIAMISAMTANAQVEQGKLFINGQFGVSSTSYKADSDHKKSSFTLMPSVGYFVSDQFAVGLGVGVSTNKDKNTTSNVTTTTTDSYVSIAPFVRYYIPTAGDKFHFFAQSRLGFGFGKEKTKYSNTSVTLEDKTNYINFNISPGFAYFPSSHWSLELLLNGFYIDSQKNPNNDNSGVTTVGLDVNSLVPNVGISYFF